MDSFTDKITGRNLLGGIFPLVTTAMFTNLGYPGASSLLGGIVSHIECFIDFPIANVWK